MHPVAAARLIGDLSVVTVETSGPALAGDLQSAGIDARWVLPPRNDLSGLLFLERPPVGLLDKPHGRVRNYCPVISPVCADRTSTAKPG
jgi:hypothetical protein